MPMSEAKHLTHVDMHYLAEIESGKYILRK